MSMNLHCDGLELRQTPTWITKLALWDSNNIPRSVEETKHIYLSWVRSMLNGVWTEENNFHRDLIKAHIRDVNSATITEFWEM